MSQAQTAVYGRQLEEGWIRLLKVEESHPRGRLQFSLFRVKIRTGPDYTAISYTWGDVAETESIIINDHPFWIRPNLFACLYCLSSQLKYVWVDAICINQQDNVERKKQVMIMDQIYSTAKSVAVWLGPETFQHIPRNNISVNDLKATRSEWQRSIIDMASRPYWSRRWIIQEFLVAREVRMHFGYISIGSISFFGMLQEALLTNPLASPEQDPLRQAECEVACTLLKEREMTPHHYKRPLYELLIRHAAAQCSNPEDKVFAFLGISLIDKDEFFAEYLPDYELDYEQVLVITFAHLRSMSGHEAVKPLMQALDLGPRTLRNVLRQAEKLERKYAKEKLAPHNAMDPDNAAMLAEGMHQSWLVRLEDRMGLAFESFIYGDDITDDATIESVLRRYLPWQRWTLSYVLIRFLELVAPVIYAITIYTWVAMLLILCLLLSAITTIQSQARRLYQYVTPPLLKASEVETQAKVTRKRNRRSQRSHKPR